MNFQAWICSQSLFVYAKYVTSFMSKQGKDRYDWSQSPTQLFFPSFRSYIKSRLISRSIYSKLRNAHVCKKGSDSVGQECIRKESSQDWCKYYKALCFCWIAMTQFDTTNQILPQWFNILENMIFLLISWVVYFWRESTTN